MIFSVRYWKNIISPLFSTYILFFSPKNKKKIPFWSIFFYWNMCFWNRKRALHCKCSATQHINKKILFPLIRPLKTVLLPEYSIRNTFTVSYWHLHWHLDEMGSRRNVLSFSMSICVLCICIRKEMASGHHLSWLISSVSYNPRGQIWVYTHLY